MAYGLQARRFGPVNWIGCRSLLRRQFKNGFSDLSYTIIGPVISNALYLLLFVIASSSLTALDPKSLVTFIAPGLVCFTIAERAFEVSGATLGRPQPDGLGRAALGNEMKPGSSAHWKTGFHRVRRYCSR